jgi:PAS domain S-box-containing protein
MSTEDETVTKTIDDEIQSVRMHVAYRLQQAGLVFGIIVLVAMVPLYPEIIEFNILASFGGIYLALAVLFILRKRLSYKIQTWVLLGLLFTAGGLALVVWGLVGMGIPVFFVLPMIATLFYGMREGVISTIVVTGFIAMVAVLTTQGVLHPMVDADAYQHHPISWVNTIAVVVFLASLLIAILGTVNRRLLDFIGARDQHTEEMMVANRRLRSEINKKRTAQRELVIKDKVVDSSLNAVAFADLNGVLTYVNQSFLDFWGHDRFDEVIGRPIAEFWTDADAALQVVEHLEQTGESSGEMVARRADSSTFIAKYNATLVIDKDGSPLCMAAILEDITKQREYETMLEEENDWRKVMLEAGSLVAANLEFDHTFGPVAQALRQVVPVDHMMVVLVESDNAVFRVVETTSDRQSSIYPDMSVPLAGSFLEALQKTGESLIVNDLKQSNSCFPDESIIREEGLRSCVRIPLYNAGRFLGMLALSSRRSHAFDNAHLRHLETLALQVAQTVANIQRYQQMRGEAEHLAVIVREVHHRIKNNLQGVIGLFGRYRDEQPQLAPVLNNAIAQLYAVAEVHNLLSHHTHETVSWHSLIQGVCQVTDNLSPHRVECTLAPDTAHLMVAASEAVPLALALNELIQNAINHGYPDGRIGTIRLSAEPAADGARVWLRVADDGIAPSQLLDSDNGDGFGLGLELVQSLLPENSRFQIRHQDDWTVAEVSLPLHAFVEQENH